MSSGVRAGFGIKIFFMKLMICLNIDEMIKSECLIGECYGEIG